MIEYTTARSSTDLNGILQLQQQNLTGSLTGEERKSQGFVTVRHSVEDLDKLNTIEPQVIAKENERVIAYLLAMTQHSRSDIPVLRPMFELFQQISFVGKKVDDYHYLVVGQVCVDKDYRGKGILDHCYAYYKKHFRRRYDFAITEIAASNARSLAAHKRIGFQEIHRYKAQDEIEWVIVLWDWNNLAHS